MNKTVVFTEDFATKKQGDEYTCDSLLASRLVRLKKVAKYKKKEQKKAPEEKVSKSKKSDKK